MCIPVSLKVSCLLITSLLLKKNIIVSTSTNDIIQWIEEETGLTYNEQFQLVEEGNGRLFFLKNVLWVFLFQHLALLRLNIVRMVI